MKTLNNMLKKINLLAIMGIIVAMGAVAFTAPEKNALDESYRYDLTSEDPLIFQDPDNWSSVNLNETSSCDQDPGLPCVITIKEELESYLTKFSTIQQLLEASEVIATKSNPNSN